MLGTDLLGTENRVASPPPETLRGWRDGPRHPPEIASVCMYLSIYPGTGQSARPYVQITFEFLVHPDFLSPCSMFIYYVSIYLTIYLSIYLGCGRV